MVGATTCTLILVGCVLAAGFVASFVLVTHRR